MRSIVLSIFFLATLYSCRKNDSPTLTAEDSFAGLFHSFWTKLNQRYVYWDIDRTDWDAAYLTYLPLFQQLDLNNANDVRRSVDYFRQMTSALIDGHFSIRFTHPSISDSLIIPSMDRLRTRPDFHNRYDHTADVKKILTEFREGRDQTTLPGKNVYALCGRFSGKTLYFTCDVFHLSRIYHSPSGNIQFKAVMDYFLSAIHSPTPPRGIILDLRNNLGGDIADLNWLLAELTNTSVLYGYSRIKTGNGRVDFSPWLPAEIKAAASSRFNGPIVVLADQYSASLSESMLLALRQWPVGTSVGETTFGATGPVADTAVFRAGPFAVSDFMQVTLSSVSFKFTDGTSFEGTGVKPDHVIKFDLTALQGGTDAVLQEAIRLTN